MVVSGAKNATGPVPPWTNIGTAQRFVPRYSNGGLFLTVAVSFFPAGAGCMQDEAMKFLPMGKHKKITPPAADRRRACDRWDRKPDSVSDGHLSRLSKLRRSPFSSDCPLPASRGGLFGVARWWGLPRSTRAVAGATRLYGPFIATADHEGRARIRRRASPSLATGTNFMPG